MAVIESWFKQDLKKPVQVHGISGNLFSADNQGNLIGVEVFDNGEAATLSGTVTANIIRPDGGTVAVTGSYTGNKASVVLPAAAYAVPGNETIVIKITDSSVVTTLTAVVVTVYRSTTDTVVDPGTVMPSIQTLISQIETAVASIPADYSSLWTTLAPAFSTSTSYAAGQYVTYNGKMWRFIVAHSAGAWNSAHVSEVKIGNELTDLKSAITKDILFQNGTNELFDIKHNLSISGAGKWTSQDTSFHAVIPVQGGERLHIVANSNRASIIAALKNYSPINDTNASFSTATGWTERVVFQAGEESGSDFALPSDAKYLYVLLIANTSIEYTPDVLEINGIDVKFNIRNEIQNTKEQVDDLGDTIYDVINGNDGLMRNLQNAVIDESGNWGSEETAKHVIVPVVSGQTFKIKASSQRSAIFAVLKNGEVLIGRSANFSSTSGFTQRFELNAGETSDEYTVPSDGTCLYITAIVSETVNMFPSSVLINGIEMNDNIRAHIADIEKEIKDTNEKLAEITPGRIELKVCSYNVGMYNYGRDTSQHERLYLDEKIEALKEFISENDFDIIACQEATDINDAIFTGYLTAITKAYLLNISAKEGLANRENGAFTAKYNDESRYWLKAEIEINGKTITLFNCHLSWQEDALSVRLQQHQEIITMLEDVPYAIVFGDFNAYEISEFDDFVTAGYKLANGGYLSAKNTCPSLNPEKPMDNVLLKGINSLRIKSAREIGPNIEITPTVVNPAEDQYDRYLSDHMPMISRIIIRY